MYYKCELEYFICHPSSLLLLLEFQSFAGKETKAIIRVSRIFSVILASSNSKASERLNLASNKYAKQQKHRTSQEISIDIDTLNVSRSGIVKRALFSDILIDWADQRVKT